MEQSVFSCNDYSNKYKENVNNQFAWVAKNGDADLIKTVGKKASEDEE